MRGVWGRKQGCAHSHGHALSHPCRKEEVTPGSYIYTLSWKKLLSHGNLILCGFCTASRSHDVVWDP